MKTHIQWGSDPINMGRPWANLEWTLVESWVDLGGSWVDLGASWVDLGWILGSSWLDLGWILVDLG